MADRRQRKTRLIAASAMLSALGVVLIAAATLLDVLDLTMAALASLLTVFAVIEIGQFYPWLIFAVTSILSLVLLPRNSGAYCYLLFFGYYPIIKSVFERKLPKPLAWLCKFLVFNLGFSGYVFLFADPHYQRAVSRRLVYRRDVWRRKSSDVALRSCHD